MDTVYVVFYSGYDNEIAEIFEDYDEAMKFIEAENANARAKQFKEPFSSIPEPYTFNPQGTKWGHE